MVSVPGTTASSLSMPWLILSLIWVRQLRMLVNAACTWRGLPMAKLIDLTWTGGRLLFSPWMRATNRVLATCVILGSSLADDWLASVGCDVA